MHKNFIRRLVNVCVQARGIAGFMRNTDGVVLARGANSPTERILSSTMSMKVRALKFNFVNLVLKITVTYNIAELCFENR